MRIVADLSTPAPAVLVSFSQDMVVMVLMVLAGFRRLPALLLWPPGHESAVSVAGTGGCVAVESHAGCRTGGPLVGARFRVVLGAGRHGTTLRTSANRIPRRRWWQCQNGRRDCDLVHPVLCCLRPCWQQCRDLSADADRDRGISGHHRALFQPHGLRRVARPASSRR